VGLDGYRLDGVPDEFLLVPGEPGVGTASGAADRGTLRVSSVAQVGEEGVSSGTLTFAAEQSVLRERAAEGGTWAGASYDAPDSSSYDAPAVTWRENTGLVAQANAAFHNALYLTGGIRFERDAGAGDLTHSATLPMVGAALVRDHGAASVKLRAAYGKGIRSPRTSVRLTTQPGMRTQGFGLAPEQQSGVEAGVDLTVGRRLTMQVTRFDQLASGLIQRVVLMADDGMPRETPEHRLRYRLQNVGEIANRGWELQASLGGSAFSLAGSLSLVDSRVRRIAANYAGDLRPGDRMLEVPARTSSLTAAWAHGGTRASLGAVHAADWINYDRVALARAVADGSVSDAMGARLRGYWMRYDGVTRLRASATQTLTHGLALQLTGENLLGVQRGEPDNATVLPGRMVTAGVRLDF
jgi:iron complex outermembrane receptor protein